MRILHYSDMGDKNIGALYQECDVLVTTGDLSYFDVNFLEQIQVKKPAFGVYGNHDVGGYMESLGITSLHKKVVDFGGKRWGGWQSCLKYKEGGFFFTEEEAEEFADTFQRVDILLLHAGPKGMLDDPRDPTHTGSYAIRRYVLEKKPNFVFCGHQDSDDHLNYEGVNIIRTFGARYVEI